MNCWDGCLAVFDNTEVFDSRYHVYKASLLRTLFYTILAEWSLLSVTTLSGILFQALHLYGFSSRNLTDRSLVDVFPTSIPPIRLKINPNLMFNWLISNIIFIVLYLTIIRYYVVIWVLIINLTELKTLEWWISVLMLNPLFFLISRLNIACFPHELNLQIN